MPDDSLDERDFISPVKNKKGLPSWFLFLMLLLTTLLVSAAVLWVNTEVYTQVREKPFLNVTNREFSLFLWQNFQYMRPHAKDKVGYLPGFYASRKMSPKLEDVDRIVVAPPETLFLYHTWNRLLFREFTPRMVATDEFREFLDYAEEWKPENWPEAPERYVNLVNNLDFAGSVDFLTKLPLNVYVAFVGWKNYTKELEMIARVRPTNREMREFLLDRPHYKRNYWQNIYPGYLKSSLMGGGVVPQEEIPIFLKLAFFNYMKARDEGFQRVSSTTTSPSS